MSGKHWLATALMALFMLPAIADQWSSTLQGGGIVTVDPESNRASITRDGVTTPLWNGIHRMQDGSSLIVNRGVAVPTQPILESRRLPAPETREWQDVNIVGYSPCEQLVRQVCGRQNQCADVEACDPANQLLDMEQQERRDSDNPNLMTYTSGQCLNAMKDREYFSPCTRPEQAEAGRP
jgi:hypothetical protein